MERGLFGGARGGRLGIQGPLRGGVVIWEPEGTFGDRDEPLGVWGGSLHV